MNTPVVNFGDNEFNFQWVSSREIEVQGLGIMLNFIQ